MSKHTKIEKIEGEPYLENHYCLYSGVDLVGNAVPFSVLAAAQDMLEALKALCDDWDKHVAPEWSQTNDEVRNRQCLHKQARAAIAKAECP